MYLKDGYISVPLERYEGLIATETRVKILVGEIITNDKNLISWDILNILGYEKEAKAYKEKSLKDIDDCLKRLNKFFKIEEGEHNDVDG